MLAIGVQVTMMLTLVGLSRGMVEGSANRTRGVGADIMVRPTGAAIIGMNGAPMPEGIVDFLQKQPHVALATGTVVHVYSGVDSITGLDLPKFNAMSGGFRFIEGGTFQTPNDILIDESFARQHKLNAGGTVNLMNRDWHVAGVVESGKLGRVFLPIKVLQELTAATGKITVAYVKVDDPRNTRAVVDQIHAKIPDNPVYAMEDFLALVSVDNIPGLNSFIRVIVGLSVIFGFLVVFLAMYTAVLERTREIGILKALGASPGYIIRLLLHETVLIAVIGSIVGILLTYGTRWIIMARYPASLTQVIVPDWWPNAALISLLGAVLGAMYPGLKAARQDAIEALSYE
ncbi:MAG TPA: FtsX-like permease family protein [Bryobacteraceae bacterium]|nr:FtsX-like permease family protein [Bryobacteraceae bacterium]